MTIILNQLFFVLIFQKMPKKGCGIAVRGLANDDEYLEVCGDSGSVFVATLPGLSTGSRSTVTTVYCRNDDG